MKQVKFIGYILLSLGLLGACKKDKVQDIPKGNDLPKDTAHFNNAKAYENGDTLILLLEDASGSHLQFRLFESNDQKTYKIGANSKNEVRYFYKPDAIFYSSKNLSANSTVEIANFNRQDSSLELSFHISMANIEDGFDLFDYNLDTAEKISYTHYDDPGFIEYWELKSKNLGSMQTGDYFRNLKMEGDKIRFIVNCNVKEFFILHLPKNIASGNYDITQSSDTVGIIEFNSAFNFNQYTATQGQFSIEHDRVNQVIILRSNSLKLENIDPDVLIAEELFIRVCYR